MIDFCATFKQYQWLEVSRVSDDHPFELSVYLLKLTSEQRKCYRLIYDVSPYSFVIWVYRQSFRIELTRSTFVLFDQVLYNNITSIVLSCSKFKYVHHGGFLICLGMYIFT